MCVSSGPGAGHFKMNEAKADSPGGGTHRQGEEGPSPLVPKILVV